MRIVWAVPLVPYPPTDGGSIRIYRLLKGLARRHAVHLLALSDGAHDAESLARLRELCAVDIFDMAVPRERRWSTKWWRHHWRALKGPAVAYYHPVLPKRLTALVEQGQADVILLETLKMAGYGIRPDSGDAVAGARSRMILCRQNCETTLARRMAGGLPLSRLREKAYWRLGHWRLAGVDPRVVSRYRFITTVSEQEAAIFRRFSPQAEVIVVPNGTDLGSVAGSAAASDGKTVALVGSLGYPPNQDAARYFCRTIWPLIHREQPDARLVVVGREARAQLGPWCRDPSVDVRDPSVDPRRELTGGIIVVPLRAGAGTRIKILEALAARRAVVSTTIGCEGLDVVPGRDLLVADEPALFAQCVIQLLRDSSLRQRLGENGRSVVEQHYRWDSAVDALERFCLRVAGPPADKMAAFR